MTGPDPATRAVDVGGVVMRYRTAGEPGAPAVLLLHGGGSSAATWDRLTGDITGRGLRVVAPDLRGHGGSDRTAAYPLAGFRDDVLGLLDALGLGPVALAGHSLGAHVASVIAQEQPDRVTRLLLEEPPVPARRPGDGDGLSSGRFLGPALAALALRRGYDRRALISVVRQLRQPNPGWWAGLAAISAPTLVVSGGPASHIGPRRLADVTVAVPHARLVTIPAGHRVHSHEPDRFAAVAAPFLAGAQTEALTWPNGDQSRSRAGR